MKIINADEAIAFIRSVDDPIAKGVLIACYGTLLSMVNAATGNADVLFLMKVVYHTLPNGNAIEEILRDPPPAYPDPDTW